MKDALLHDREAVEALGADVGEHFIRRNQAALEQAASCIQADLTKHKEKFKCLKSTNNNQDTKRRFIQGLSATDISIDQENATLRQLEATHEHISNALRNFKHENGSLQAQNKEAVQELCSSVNELKAATAAVLANVAGVLEEYEGHEAVKPPMPSPLPHGLSEEECEKEIQREMAIAQELERKIASINAGIADITASSRLNTNNNKKTQLEILRQEPIAFTKAKQDDAAARDKRAADWCSSLRSIMNKLDSQHISAQHIDSNSISFELLPCSSDTPSKATPHVLTLFVRYGTTDVIKGKLSPSTIPIDNIIAKAPKGRSGIFFIVATVQALLSGSSE